MSKLVYQKLTAEYWGILNKTPDKIMCSSSRMIVKRKSDTKPRVVACTLLPINPNLNWVRPCEMHPNKYF